MKLTILFKRKKQFSRKNPTVGLPEVSKLIESAISKGQVVRRKHRFLERKTGKWIHYEHPEYHITWWIVLWSNPLINFTEYFFISQRLACNAEKNITVEDNKKRMNITNFINITLYIPILHVREMTENKNDSINSCYWQ